LLQVDHSHKFTQNQKAAMFENIFSHRETKPQFAQKKPPYLKNVLNQLTPHPSRTMMLGVCDDGLPLLLDLTNPAPGAILAVSDVQYANITFVKSLLSSACFLNTPGQLQVHILSLHKNDFPDFYKRPHFTQQISPNQPNSHDLIEALCDLVEVRQRGQNRGPAHLLVIDGLDLILNNSKERQLADFLWLIQEGPLHRVWPLVTLGSSYFKEDMLSIIERFGTYVIGRVEASTLINHLAGDAVLDTSHLVPGVEALVYSGFDFIHIQIPRPKEQPQGFREEMNILEDVK
jgi:hypothetical protein